MSKPREWRQFEAARVPLLGHRRIPRGGRVCPCGCGTPGFCDAHKQRLADIRAGLEGDLKFRGRYAQRSDQRLKRGPTCCNPGCWESRPRDERYCALCRAEGWSEDDLA